MVIDYSKFNMIEVSDDEEAETSNGGETDSNASTMQVERIHMPSALLAENFSKNVAYCERNVSSCFLRSNPLTFMFSDVAIEHSRWCLRIHEFICKAMGEFSPCF